MDDAVPLIYVRGSDSSRLPALGRLTALGVALACLAPLIVAAFVTPSPEGLGSHTELGLPRCQFLEYTGFPCWSCGMTTSWAWFVRGNVAASLYVQPMGAVLAAMAIGCFWGGVYIAATGRPIYRILRLFPGRYYFLPLFCLFILAWAWKIFIHLTGRDGW